MYGAIIGDIVGSRFEFDRGDKSKDFELFTKEDNFTDDTVMTVAIAEALLEAGKDAGIDDIEKACIKAMQKWGRKYPHAGYGGNFRSWLREKNPIPYNSLGNGSAMRVSATGWLYDSLERTMEVARATAYVSHNHPEGIKGAECTAAVIFMARNGKSKEEIGEFISEKFEYDYSKSLDEIRPTHRMNETCMDAMPCAIRSFMEGESYEDVIRNAVSLGGDTDTIAAIAGSMAEAFFGIPVTILAEGKSFLSDDILDVISRFDVCLGRVTENREEVFANNRYIKQAIDEFEANVCQERYAVIMDALLTRLLEDGEAPVPMVDKDGVLASIAPDKLMPWEAFSLDQDLRMTIDTVQDGEGKLWIPLFTDYEELNKQPTTNLSINLPILTIIQSAMMDNVDGLVINPFGKGLTINKNILAMIIQAYDENK